MPHNLVTFPDWLGNLTTKKGEIPEGVAPRMDTFPLCSVMPGLHREITASGFPHTNPSRFQTVSGLSSALSSESCKGRAGWSNGMVEGFNHKVKLIKRSSYGQAGFPLLQRRVLLHPAAREPFYSEKMRRSSRTSASAEHHDASNSRSTPTAFAEASIA